LSLSEVWGPAADRLLIVGLTGGIASGKSEVARELERLGATVIDADRVARDVVLPGTDAYKELVEEFGHGILDGDGKIDRAALSRLVFTDDARLNRLNQITHPHIIAGIIGDVNRFAVGLKPNDVPAVIVDAALIVDIGASGVFDLVVVVTADDDVRAVRLVRDRGMSEREARSRIESQVLDCKRIKIADTIVHNNSTMEKLASRVSEVWSEIERRAVRRYS